MFFDKGCGFFNIEYFLNSPLSRKKNKFHFRVKSWALAQKENMYVIILVICPEWSEEVGRRRALSLPFFNMWCKIKLTIRNTERQTIFYNFIILFWFGAVNFENFIAEDNIMKFIILKIGIPIMFRI